MKASLAVTETFNPTDSETSTSLLPSVNNQLMVLPTEFQNPQGVLTRERSAMLMGKRLGLVFECSDEEATRGIASQIAARHC